eukprot:CAMPEP_0206540714 /NCGR_PEP_ID=MMETSP0325_2-20121206/9173_1 /ASSEMBLY_ACC=CAM_ASM_000347 /TAXON_ID=2866 /ORGANISM="Crypthecodinium cohnii, Strain Seligo" /LENGTH=49 /DNA_ID=CAMNT_0054038497 /DNA_START=632 /DNA_END=781 /DNA_ORIENTATION=-
MELPSGIPRTSWAGAPEELEERMLRTKVSVEGSVGMGGGVSEYRLDAMR